MSPAHWSGSEMSAANVNAEPPPSLISAAKAATLVSEMSCTTVAPRSAKARASTVPMAPPAPVNRMRMPSMRKRSAVAGRKGAGFITGLSVGVGDRESPSRSGESWSVDWRRCEPRGVLRSN